MDFFETREKYRRREISIYSRWIARLFFLGLALWLGWQWGSLEQRQIQADRDLVLYERAQRIELLNRDVERLNHDLRELKAEKEALGLTQSFGDSKLTRLIKGQIARGTTIEQIHQRLQALGAPVNCRNIENKTVAVATELYSGVESNITFFDGGWACMSKASLPHRAQKTILGLILPSPYLCGLSILARKSWYQGCCR